MWFDVAQGNIAAQRADEFGCGSLVVPVGGTGAAGLDSEVGARCVCETIDAYGPTKLTDVRVIAYSDDEYRTAASIADRVSSPAE